MVLMMPATSSGHAAPVFRPRLQIVAEIVQET
jgi:hypothetical protein